MAGALIIRGNRLPSGNTNGDLDTLLKSTAGTRVQERLLMLQQISYGCVGTDGKLKRMPANGGDNQGPNARLPPLRCDDGDVGSVDNYDALLGPNSWRDSGRFTTVNGVTLPRFVGAVAGAGASGGAYGLVSQHGHGGVFLARRRCGRRG